MTSHGNDTLVTSLQRESMSTQHNYDNVVPSGQLVCPHSCTERLLKACSLFHPFSCAEYQPTDKSPSIHQRRKSHNTLNYAIRMMRNIFYVIAVKDCRHPCGAYRRKQQLKSLRTHRHVQLYYYERKERPPRLRIVLGRSLF